MFSKVLPYCNFNFDLSCRYFGSKTWSVPDLFYHKFSNIFKVSTKFNWNSKGYRWDFKVMDNEQLKEKIKPLLPYFFMTINTTGTASEEDTNSWTKPFDYEPLPNNPLFTPDLTYIPGKVNRVKSGDFVDFDTGFKASVTSNDSKNEILVGFGAANSLFFNVHTDKEKRKMQSKQLFSAFSCWLGAKPLIYEQAQNLAKALKEKYPTKKIILTGNCLGGSLAQYAALKNKLPAYCLNSIQLGAGLQSTITQDEYDWGSKNITHLSVKGDILTDWPLLSYIDRFVSIMFKLVTPANFGDEKLLIPSAHNSSLRDHNRPYDSIVKLFVPEYDPKQPSFLDKLIHKVRLFITRKKEALPVFTLAKPNLYKIFMNNIQAFITRNGEPLVSATTVNAVSAVGSANSPISV